MSNVSQMYVEDMRKKIGHDLLILIGSNIILENEDAHVLLQKRTNGSWGLPGGLMEIGESLEETAIREVHEETGLEVTDLKLVNTFSGPQYQFTLENKDQIYVVTSVYKVISYKGIMNLESDETLDLKYFPYDSLPENMEDEYLDYIKYYLANFVQ
ncbi:NUDIX hydrolase [Floricoccus tropicus]|uniref:NUDIX hydrolase n=1 Tax=Floricoccus tropicus TaxID=1859473 RepID=A0A1E8GRV6_9LACT|nr:NUDIX hydrolase [Floricoccus tropicus]OFI50353.1 NUDIX hydrolase [Floricoccus tropicus]